MAVVVTTPPYDNVTTTAINIIKAALANDKRIIGVFFYKQGVLNASKHLALASDEFQPQQHWQHLASQHNIPLYLCSTAAEKHGLLVEENDNKDEFKLIDSAFNIAGLGELVALSTQADRILQL